MLGVVGDNSIYLSGNNSTAGSVLRRCEQGAMICVGRGSKLSVKGPIVNILGFVGCSFCHNYSTLLL